MLEKRAMMNAIFSRWAAPIFSPRRRASSPDYDSWASTSTSTSTSTGVDACDASGASACASSRRFPATSSRSSTSFAFYHASVAFFASSTPTLNPTLNPTPRRTPTTTTSRRIGPGPRRSCPGSGSCPPDFCPGFGSCPRDLRGFGSAGAFSPPFARASPRAPDPASPRAPDPASSSPRVPPGT